MRSAKLELRDLNSQNGTFKINFRSEKSFSDMITKVHISFKMCLFLPTYTFFENDTMRLALSQL